MKIPKTTIYDITNSAANRIIKASQKPCSIGQQIVMTNYFAYLNATKNTAAANFAKINFAK